METQAGGVIEAEYDVPPDAWYFAADRQDAMPFVMLLETALQPCGWMAAYLGAALDQPGPTSVSATSAARRSCTRRSAATPARSPRASASPARRARPA